MDNGAMVCAFGFDFALRATEVRDCWETETCRRRVVSQNAPGEQAIIFANWISNINIYSFVCYFRFSDYDSKCQ